MHNNKRTVPYTLRYAVFSGGGTHALRMGISCRVSRPLIFYLAAPQTFEVTERNSAIIIIVSIIEGI